MKTEIMDLVFWISMLKHNMQLNFCFIYVLLMFSFTYVLNVPYFQKQPLHWLNAKFTLRFDYAVAADTSLNS